MQNGLSFKSYLPKANGPIRSHIQQRFIESLLLIRHRSRLWAYRDEHDKQNLCPCGESIAHSLNTWLFAHTIYKALGWCRLLPYGSSNPSSFQLLSFLGCVGHPWSLPATQSIKEKRVKLFLSLN